ncbi:MAG: carboxymuconolactone decarboxylase family protein [Burkholderiaceae bacterium]|nr:carboxymuconolactone decarboxylase family protein [Burkholderiaceae bacterium]
MPLAFMGMAAMYGSLDRKSSPLEPTLRSLVQVRVSQINDCAHCIDLNSSVGLGRGVLQSKLAALLDPSERSQFSERERAALDYAEAITDSNRRTSAGMVASLREHFSEDAIVELTALVAFQNMSSKFNAALGVPAQGFCAVPNR